MEIYKQYDWCALQVPYKKEKFVAKLLASKGIEAYVPLYRKTKMYNRKRKEYQLPLLTNYVLVKIEKNQKISVLQTPYVSKFVSGTNGIGHIPEYEIQLLKRICDEGIDFHPTPINENHVGYKVEIAYGNLSGIQGILIEVCGKKLVKVMLDQLGLYLCIHIDKSCLKQIDNFSQVA
ncbi:MAG: UpxY family transcription antiterminator [Bacteroidota bacterium]|nr:UpxY family transcription antiterminator [Bacteroidota bacterium]